MYYPVAWVEDEWKFTSRYGLRDHTREARLIIETLRRLDTGHEEYRIFLRRLLQIPMAFTLHGKDHRYMQLGKKIIYTPVDIEYPENVFDVFHTQKDNRWINTKQVLDMYGRVSVPAISLAHGLAYLEQEERNNSESIQVLQKEFLNLEWIVEDYNKFKAVLLNNWLFLVGQLPDPYKI